MIYQLKNNYELVIMPHWLALLEETCAAIYYKGEQQ